MTSELRPAWAEIDLAAVRANVEVLRRACAPAGLLAVVKADAYGHGAVPVSRAALDAGASALGVALVEEGVALREAGIDAPILVLSEPVVAAAPVVVRHGLEVAVYTERGIDALAQASSDAGAPLRVHLKVDTGMHRVGCAPGEAPALARRVVDTPGLELAGLWTHLAVADELANPYTDAQLFAFTEVVGKLAAEGIHAAQLHAANSAGAIAHPQARFDLVRPGIAVYGIEPAAGIGRALGLRPALSLRACITFVKPLERRERLSYGLRYTLADDAWVATVPLGYADGVPRNLAAVGGEVLVGGRRCPIAGTVTMDQLLVDLGPSPAAVGDEVVLLGEQGGECITAQEWADRLGTIAYEIVTGVGPRVPRRYLGGSAG